MFTGGLCPFSGPCTTMHADPVKWLPVANNLSRVLRGPTVSVADGRGRAVNMKSRERDGHGSSFATGSRNAPAHIFQKAVLRAPRRNSAGPINFARVFKGFGSVRRPGSKNERTYCRVRSDLSSSTRLAVQILGFFVFFTILTQQLCLVHAIGPTT